VTNKESVNKRSDDKKPSNYLAKRQQEIMEIIYTRGRADVAAVMEDLPADLSNPAVRAHLRALEDSGHLMHISENGKFIYEPTKPRQNAAQSALGRLLKTFFDNSMERVVATLLSVKAADLDPEELERMKTMIDEARDAKAQNAKAHEDEQAKYA